MKKNNILERIVTTIRAGRLKQRSRFHFILQTLLLALVVVAASAAVVFIIGWVRLWLHRSGVWFLPGFGLRGWQLFIGSFPWVTVIVIGALVIAVEVLLRRYGVVYRRPLLYSLGAVVCLLIVAGVMLDVRRLDTRVADFDMPGTVFRRGEGPVIIGQVIGLPDDRIVLQDAAGRTLIIVNKREVPFFSDDVVVGDMVVVGGFVRDRDNTLDAFGIRPVRRELLYLPRPPAFPGADTPDR